ncbi:MAG: hypothetical protein ACTSV5_01875 [Promethearchaeota archaeon]
MTFCPGCGIQTESNWQVCPMCGYKFQDVFQSNTTNTSINPPPIIYDSSQQSERNTYGIEALVFAILGFIMIPIFGSVLGIVFGIKGKEKDDNPSYALFGLILGIIGLAYWLIFGFAIISFFITILSLMGPTY